MSRVVSCSRHFWQGIGMCPKCVEDAGAWHAVTEPQSELSRLREENAILAKEVSNLHVKLIDANDSRDSPDAYAAGLVGALKHPVPDGCEFDDIGCVKCRAILAPQPALVTKVRAVVDAARQVRADYDRTPKSARRMPSDNEDTLFNALADLEDG